MDRQQLFGSLWAIVTADPVGELVRHLRREGITVDQLREALVGLTDCVPESADPELADRLESASADLLRRFQTDRAPRPCEPAIAVAGAGRQRKAR